MADGVLGKDIMQTSLPRLRGGTSADDGAGVADLLRAEGVVVIEGALAPHQLERVRGQLGPWFEQAKCGEGALFGTRTKRFAGLFAKAPACADLALDPLVLGAMEALLRGPDPAAPVCNAIELNLTQAIGIGPGEPAQFLHRDEELWPFPHPGVEIMANALWTLDDFTTENGATRLIPQSHCWPRDRAPEPGETVVATAPAGSVVLWTGGVLHGGGANRSEALRRGVVMSYRVGWLAPTEKLLLSTPPACARLLPTRLQQLLGYQLHAPNLGWIEGRDPVEWLRGEVGQLAPVKDNLTPALEEVLGASQKNPEAFAGYLS